MSIRRIPLRIAVLAAAAVTMLALSAAPAFADVVKRGNYTVRAGVTIDDNIKVYGGTLTVNGKVEGNVYQYRGGSVIVGRYAYVDGNVEEERAGRVEVRGRVEGDVEEKGAGNLLIYPSARIAGDISESGSGRIIRY